MKEDCQTIYQH